LATLAIGTGRAAPGPGTRPTPLMSAADSPAAGQATAPSRWLWRMTGAGSGFAGAVVSCTMAEPARQRAPAASSARIFVRWRRRGWVTGRRSCLGTITRPGSPAGECSSQRAGWRPGLCIPAPLTAMTAVTDILYEHPGLSGNAATAARLVHHGVIHLNRLVEDLTEISRFDAGTATLVTDDTDVATTIGRCLRTRGWSRVSTEVPAGLTAVLDRRRFDVILANLVGNALRHGAPPVTVTGATQPDGHGGQRLAVAVRDHGAGLPGTEIPHLFDRFYKPTPRGHARRAAAWPGHRPGKRPLARWPDRRSQPPPRWRDLYHYAAAERACSGQRDTAAAGSTRPALTSARCGHAVP
jgi:Histidine kinase-, DNA gyrase B-, and HSP90-like ATPase